MLSPANTELSSLMHLRADDLVPVRGLEPPRGCPQWILNPSRLPIPPHRRVEQRVRCWQAFRLLVQLQGPVWTGPRVKAGNQPFD